MSEETLNLDDIKKVTLGTDPEFFIKDKKGSYVSAIPHVPGTKDAPEEMECGSLVQHDNVAIEFSTPVAKDVQEFINGIKRALNNAKKLVPAEHTLSVDASASFPEKELEDEEAQVFGCEPDYDAWEVSQNDPPACPDVTFRSCGGHIHVGYVEDSGNEFLLDFQGKLDTVRGMDLFHGVISVILDNTKESLERRKLYGKAGAHRPKEYGVEYRVLSNYWLKSPILVSLQTSLLYDVIKVIRQDNLNALIELVGQDTIVGTINNSDIETAKRILKEHLVSYLSTASKELLEECKEIQEDLDTNWKTATA